MKKNLFLLFLAVLFAVPSFAQKQEDKDKEARRKEMLEFKLDYLAKEIDLRDDQKKQFNELYTQMEVERRAIYKKIKKAEKSVADKDASEAAYEKASKEIQAARAEMVQIEQQYDEKFASFLSKKQMFKLREAEGKFMQKMQDCKEKRKSKKRK